MHLRSIALVIAAKEAALLVTVNLHAARVKKKCEEEEVGERASPNAKN